MWLTSSTLIWIVLNCIDNGVSDSTCSSALTYVRALFFLKSVLVFLADGRTLVGPVLIPSQSWQTLKGTFSATATTMMLALYNHVATGIGNDYAVDNIRVREL